MFGSPFGTTKDFLTAGDLIAGDGILISEFAGQVTISAELSGDYIPVSDKGVADGVATLDSSGKIPTSQLPGLALTDVFTVASEVAQLALTAQEGDIAIRTDLNKTYAHNGGSAGTMADWSELLTPTDSVTSVDGRTGVVTLSDLYEAVDPSFTHVGTGVQLANDYKLYGLKADNVTQLELLNVSPGDVVELLGGAVTLDTATNAMIFDATTNTFSADVDAPNLVTLTGNQTIAGTKTFTDGLNVGDGTTNSRLLQNTTTGLVNYNSANYSPAYAQVNDSDSIIGEFGGLRYSNNYPNYMFFGRARGDRNTPAVLNSSDAIMQILGMAWDGSTFRSPVSVTLSANGTQSAGVTPGAFSITTMNTGGTSVIRLRVDSEGNFGFNTAAPAAKMHLIATDNEFRLGYTTALHGGMLVDSTGNLNLHSNLTLGAELVTDGSFAAGSWTFGTGWSHDAVNLEADKGSDGTGTLTQAITIASGSLYKVTFTVKNRTVGSVTPTIGGVSLGAISTNGTYNFYVKAVSTATLVFTPTNTSRFSIDDVSVKAVTANGIQISSAGVVTLTDGTESYSLTPDTANTRLNLTMPTSAGRVFRITGGNFSSTGFEAFATGGFSAQYFAVYKGNNSFYNGNGNFSFGTASADRKLHVEEDNATTNAVTQVFRLTHTTSGTPANGIGVGLEFEVETSAANNEVGATIEAVTTDVTSTSEDFNLVFKTMAAGAAAAERVRINDTGMGIGGIAPAYKLDISTATAIAVRAVNTNTSSPSDGAVFTGYSNDGAAMASGDRLGGFLFGGAVDGASTYANAIGIFGYASAGWTGSSAPAYMTFETAASGGLSRTERMRIDASGNVGIGTLTNTVGARLHTISTTEQLRIGYDTTNYASITVGSGGVTTLTTTSGGSFTFSKQYNSAAYTLTDGATIAIDWNNGNVQKVVLGGNRTITFANPKAGARYLIVLEQDGTGSRTVTWPTIKWQAGTTPTLTTTAGKKDLITIIWDGTDYCGVASTNF
jgi:hypothetical protein